MMKIRGHRFRLLFLGAAASFTFDLDRRRAPKSRLCDLDPLVGIATARMMRPTPVRPLVPGRRMRSVT